MSELSDSIRNRQAAAISQSDVPDRNTAVSLAIQKQFHLKADEVKVGDVRSYMLGAWGASAEEEVTAAIEIGGCQFRSSQWYVVGSVIPAPRVTLIPSLNSKDNHVKVASAGGLAIFLEDVASGKHLSYLAYEEKFGKRFSAFCVLLAVVLVLTNALSAYSNKSMFAYTFAALLLAAHFLEFVPRSRNRYTKDFQYL
jgi:hypothetical protein